MVSVAEPRRNGCGFPNNSHSRMPNENMSERWSSGSPFTCSGDM